MGRAVFPAPCGAVMWLCCQPQWAGGFLPCPRVGACSHCWDMSLALLLYIVFQHPKSIPV